MSWPSAEIFPSLPKKAGGQLHRDGLAVPVSPTRLGSRARRGRIATQDFAFVKSKTTFFKLEPPAVQMRRVIACNSHRL